MTVIIVFIKYSANGRGEAADTHPENEAELFTLASTLLLVLELLELLTTAAVNFQDLFHASSKNFMNSIRFPFITIIFRNDIMSFLY
jgi:hypothetical protein